MKYSIECKRSDTASALLAGLLLVFFTIWTSWAVLLTHYPGTLGGSMLRAFLRLLIWVMPAIAFVYWTEGPEPMTRLGFRKNAGLGIVFGLVAALFLAPFLNLAKHGFGVPHFIFPGSVDAWLNPLISAPMAEEILFRGLVFRFISERKGFWIGMLVSSFLFALSHLPYWWISGAKSGSGLWLSLAEMGGIGALLCVMFHCKRSIWTPLIYHVANNFVSLSFFW